MNEPLPPPVGLETLGNLAPIPVHRRHIRRVSPLAGILTGVAAGFFAGRLAPNAIAWRKRRSALPVIATGLGIIAALGTMGWQMRRLFVPKPKHEVERKVGRLEVRRYPSVRIAETTVSGSWDEALKQGLARLSAFLHGGNLAHARLPMAAPVIGTGDTSGFRLAVVLPDDENTPTPDDPRVAVSDVPPRRVAVLRFNGPRDEDAIATHKRTLAQELARSGLKPHGDAFFAGYDPTSTLPFLRRNELWIELDDQVAL